MYMAIFTENESDIITILTTTEFDSVVPIYIFSEVQIRTILQFNKLLNSHEITNKSRITNMYEFNRLDSASNFTRDSMETPYPAEIQARYDAYRRDCDECDRLQHLINQITPAYEAICDTLCDSISSFYTPEDHIEFLLIAAKYENAINKTISLGMIETTLDKEITKLEVAGDKITDADVLKDIDDHIVLLTKEFYQAQENTDKAKEDEYILAGKYHQHKIHQYVNYLDIPPKLSNDMEDPEVSDNEDTEVFLDDEVSHDE